jgi:nucleoside phosphorylase
MRNLQTQWRRQVQKARGENHPAGLVRGIQEEKEMNTEKIKTLIKESGTPAQVNRYLTYLAKLASEKDNKGVLKNPWMKHKTDEYLAQIFNQVAEDGLVFDGQSITLQNTGVSYDYQAYKNKMLLAYPESVIDVGTVHTGDKFNFQKDSGQVRYLHDIADPFNRSESTIMGAYAVIKNSRGDFLTLLSKSDIAKHRKVAKTDFIWKNWYMEMVSKTIMKKACKQHFNDIFSNIERIDNDNYDLEKIADTITPEQVQEFADMIQKTNSDLDKFLKFAEADCLENIRPELYPKLKTMLSAKVAA